ncbi:hypothetical protein ASD65_01825 [Microbacterium sp. Root61]|uniref:hypothetical protein n=1 Tax=Microbacterium sp. Root61 TaxID=1736570 RepID=UPI0006FE293C|nr:hypothetical protein [Microbacterium sp. Root61]KRA23296.1 hypothetical protein ASD65_01825 [Microbacterium sp. Root61]
MTTPEQPDNNQLTRKQMREIRNTASTPIITAEQAQAAQPAHQTTEPDVEPEEAPAEEAPIEVPAPIVSAVPLARAAVPVDVAPAPAADDSVDLGVNPLTRRQARQQERIRTASVPVITPDVAAAHSAPVSARPVDEAPAPVDDAHAPVENDTQTDAADIDVTVDATAAEAEAASDIETETDDDTDTESQDDLFAATEADEAAEAEASARPVVNPGFGSGLLAGDPAALSLPPSFDELIARETSTEGSSATPNALILAQTPDGVMMGPVTATGEVLITGTMSLPDGIGSQGHAHGAADGKEADAVLVDGELPAHSSPTPIAASAAISTVKTTGEIIRPPVPEKGGKLMLSLAITAGVLALALVGVLILAFVTGVF